jgi:hypothetical protein
VENQISYSRIVMMVKSFFEKNIGLKNLSYVDVAGGDLEFGIHSMRFILNIDSMTVHRFIMADNQPMLMNDEKSILIQNRLREYIAKELGVEI